jgi:hypothetical protein
MNVRIYNDDLCIYSLGSTDAAVVGEKYAYFRR